VSRKLTMPSTIFCIFLLALHLRVDAREVERRSVDCGTDSLYVLLRLNGQHVDLGALERVLSKHGSRGYSMSELAAAARAFGLTLRGIRLGPRDIPLDRPAIAYLKNSGEGHFVVLRPVGSTGRMAQLIDPPFAPVIIDYRDLFRGPAWTGRLLLPEYGSERWAWRIGIPLAFSPFLIFAWSRFARLNKNSRALPA
jgi:hypothetical protein